MSRVQLALNVADLDQAIGFYTKLFGTAPAKVRPGYANFAVANPPLKLTLIPGGGEPGGLNHLGVEAESTAQVPAAQQRLAGLGIAVIGSGVMAGRLAPPDAGLKLPETAPATTAALIGLILIFGAASGADLNPGVTLVDRAFGSISTRDAGLYIAAQVVGGCVGAVLANLMFELPAIGGSTKAPSSPPPWVSEIIATAGL